MEEAVILHDAYIRIATKQASKANAIAEVSQRLRKIAVESGIDIDEEFRNINGITMQLSIMEYVMTEGQRGLGHPPKVFMQAAELYKTNLQSYAIAIQ